MMRDERCKSICKIYLSFLLVVQSSSTPLHPANTSPARLRDETDCPAHAYSVASLENTQQHSVILAAMHSKVALCPKLQCKFHCFDAVSSKKQQKAKKSRLYNFSKDALYTNPITNAKKVWDEGIDQHANVDQQMPYGVRLQSQ
eukprot:scaffold25861_cov18-Prasinocladus_malaysianus.AAC.1